MPQTLRTLNLILQSKFVNMLMIQEVELSIISV